MLFHPLSKLVDFIFLVFELIFASFTVPTLLTAISLLYVNVLFGSQFFSQNLTMKPIFYIFTHYTKLDGFYYFITRLLFSCLSADICFSLYGCVFNMGASEGVKELRIHEMSLNELKKLIFTYLCSPPPL